MHRDQDHESRLGEPLAAGAKGAPNYGSLAKEPAGERARRPLVERLAGAVPGLGIVFALCASFFLGSSGMLVKLTHSVHGIQVAVLRSLVQLAVYGLAIRLRGLSLRPAPGERLPVCLRATLGACSITCSYYALKLIPLGDATTIRFSLPIWTLIVGYLVLAESCGLHKVAAVVVSMCGVVLIAKPDECGRLLELARSALTGAPPDEPASEQPAGEAATSRQLEGCLLALASSVCLAMSLIALRLCRATQSEVTIFWLSLLSVLVGTGTLLGLGEFSLPDNLLDVALILANGLCGSAGQWFITNALKIEQSGVIALVRTFDIQVAFLYSAFLLHEQIRATSIVGSVLVSSGVVLVVLPKLVSARSSAAEPGPAGAPSGPGAKGG